MTSIATSLTQHITVARSLARTADTAARAGDTVGAAAAHGEILSRLAQVRSEIGDAAGAEGARGAIDGALAAVTRAAGGEEVRLGTPLLRAQHAVADLGSVGSSGGTAQVAGAAGGTVEATVAEQRAMVSALTDHALSITRGLDRKNLSTSVSRGLTPVDERIAAFAPARRLVEDTGTLAATLGDLQVSSALGRAIADLDRGVADLRMAGFVRRSVSPNVDAAADLARANSTPAEIERAQAGAHETIRSILGT